MPAKPKDFLDDKVAKAIAATEAKAEAESQTVEMLQTQFPLMTGRPVQLAIPKDITDLELFNLIVNVVALGDKLRAARLEPANAGLVIARQMPK